MIKAVEGKDSVRVRTVLAGRGWGLKIESDLWSWSYEDRGLDVHNSRVLKKERETKMGYAKGIRGGHAGGHLREPILDALEEWLSGDQEHWTGFFGSEKEARKAVGRLWHCKDILPSMTRSFVNDEFDPDNRCIGTYGQLARHLMAAMEVRVGERL